MGNEFKLDYEEYTKLLDTYNTDAATMDVSSVEVDTPDTKNVMIEKYVDMLGVIVNTVSSYKNMIATNVAEVNEVVEELKDMDDDLQNIY